MNQHTDILICGAGPVGLSTALLLLRQGIDGRRITIVDGKTLEASCADPRSIALSYGSQQILTAIHAWQQTAPHATPIHAIHVSRKGRFGRTLITREDQHVPALGYVTRYGAVVSALATLLSQTSVNVLRPVQVTRLQQEDNQVHATLSDDTTLSADIVIQAEGGIFGQQSHRTLQRDYAQTGIISKVTTATPVAHRAFERFTDEGPLALLPQDDGYALVWCVRPDTATELLSLDDKAFLQRLNAAFGHRLGQITSIEARHSYPLGLNAGPITATNIIAIGNAAQTLHPVAGQGLNLGLRDAWVLADMLGKENTPATLEKFVQLRASDRKLTIHLTDLMARIFTQRTARSPAQGLLGLSLGLLDLSGPARNLLATHMMYGYR